jgi:hypothetical protein
MRCYCGFRGSMINFIITGHTTELVHCKKSMVNKIDFDDGGEMREFLLAGRSTTTVR